MQASNTHPDIISIVDQVLTQQGTSLFSSQAPLQLHKAALAQDDISLFGFLMGKISSLWLPIQAHHLSSLGSDHTATCGLSSFVNNYFNFLIHCGSHAIPR